jgi:hypothetical protein
MIIISIKNEEGRDVLSYERFLLNPPDDEYVTYVSWASFFPTMPKEKHD